MEHFLSLWPLPKFFSVDRVTKARCLYSTVYTLPKANEDLFSFHGILSTSIKTPLVKAKHLKMCDVLSLENKKQSTVWLSGNERSVESVIKILGVEWLLRCLLHGRAKRHLHRSWRFKFKLQFASTTTTFYKVDCWLKCRLFISNFLHYVHFTFDKLNF